MVKGFVTLETTEMVGGSPFRQAGGTRVGI
jgi:hypothetical protein